MSASPAVCTEFADLPGAILAHAPTRFETGSDKGKGRSAERHYPAMSRNELKALDAGMLTLSDCVLFLWCSWPSCRKAWS